MFSGRYKLSKDSHGYFVIDRDGFVFRYLLSYLRDGPLFPLPIDAFLSKCVLVEARYFHLQGSRFFVSRQICVSLVVYIPVCAFEFVYLCGMLFTIQYVLTRCIRICVVVVVVFVFQLQSQQTCVRCSNLQNVWNQKN